MDLAHYMDEGATLAADLVNTFDGWSGREHMPDIAALRSFLAEHDLRAPRRISQRDLDELRALRDRLRAVFAAADEPAAARALNALLADAGARPRITRHDPDGWHITFEPEDSPLPQRIAASAAAGLAAMLCEKGVERFGICSDERCVDVYVDASRNASRRFCSDSCASRTHVAAHRSRRHERGRS